LENNLNRITMVQEFQTGRPLTVVKSDGTRITGNITGNFKVAGKRLYVEVWVTGGASIGSLLYVCPIDWEVYEQYRQEQKELRQADHLDHPDHQEVPGKAGQAELENMLEQQIDKYGLGHVLTTVVDICGAKADHIRENHQSDGIAQLWEHNATRLYKAIKAFRGA
jgi:hypothetical protein